HSCNIADSVFGSAMNLRNTAERVRVLHVLLKLADQFATLQQVAERGGCLQLPLVRTRLVNQVVKRLNASVKSIQRQGAHHIGRAGQTATLQKTMHSIGTHELC